MDVKVLTKTIFIHFITREWIIYSYTMTAWIGKKEGDEGKASQSIFKKDSSSGFDKDAYDPGSYRVENIA